MADRKRAISPMFTPTGLNRPQQHRSDVACVILVTARRHRYVNAGRLEEMNGYRLRKADQDPGDVIL
jgi:hypothetical protein